MSMGDVCYCEYIKYGDNQSKKYTFFIKMSLQRCGRTEGFTPRRQRCLDPLTDREALFRRIYTTIQRVTWRGHIALIIPPKIALDLMKVGFSAIKWRGVRQVARPDQ